MNNNLRIVKIIQSLLISMIIILSVGCIHENRSGCSKGLLLKFRYVSSDNLPLSPGFPEIDHLSVFIFDGNGLYIGEKKVSAIKINDDYTLLLPLYEGQYQFVVWAGLSDCYDIPACIPNQTLIGDFNLQLKQDANNQVNPTPSLLYHGWQEKVTLCPDETQEITIGLKRITNTIRVIVHSSTSEIQPQIRIEDNNGTYNYQGENISGNLFYYVPQYTQASEESDTWIADFNVMWLQSDSEAQLKIYIPGTDLQYNENLINGLLKTNPDIDLNTEHDFTIEIIFDAYYIPVSIRINGWEIISEDVN